MNKIIKQNMVSWTLQKEFILIDLMQESGDSFGKPITEGETEVLDELAALLGRNERGISYNNEWLLKT